MQKYITKSRDYMYAFIKDFIGIFRYSKYLKIYIVFLFAFSFLYIFCEFRSNNQQYTMSWLNSLYFSIVTITTLGYGDIIPYGFLSKALVSLESIFGLILIGLFLNEQAFAFSTKSEKKYFDNVLLDAFNRLDSFIYFLIDYNGEDDTYRKTYSYGERSIFYKEIAVKIDDINIEEIKEIIEFQLNEIHLGFQRVSDISRFYESKNIYESYNELLKSFRFLGNLEGKIVVMLITASELCKYLNQYYKK